MQMRAWIPTLLWGGAVLAAGATKAAESATADRPNILVIVTDDMGYSDLGCYGGEIHTPHVDQLAAGGLRFSQFYNCARCCPTRASLLTGAYPERVGMGQFGRTMDKSVPTLAENLRASGYATAMMGKWHLTQLPVTDSPEKRIRWMNHQLDLGIPFGELASYPTRRGFDQFYGIIWGVVSHFDPFSLTDGDAPVRSVPADFYLTDAISDRSVDCIRAFAESDQPFFLYVAFTAPHWPIQAPEEEIAKYRNRYRDGWSSLRHERFQRQSELGLFDALPPLGPVSGERRRWDRFADHEREHLARKMEVHAAMVDRIDQGIGRIVAGLQNTGQLDNTVIFFLSDNGASPEIPGPPGYDRHSGTRDGRVALRDAELQQPEHRAKLGSDESYTGIGREWASAVNTPLRYWKAESYEGGCRTPLVVHWPRGIKERVGRFTPSIGHVIDLSPTCLDLAGAEPRPGTLQDGLSLLPVLTGQQTITERTLYFEHEDGRGIRRNNWKAAKRGGREWELFDLTQDPGETRNLADANPELLKSLIDDWSNWYSDVTGVDDEQL
jgi:arylsulfatase